MNYMALFAIVKKPAQARGSAPPGDRGFLVPWPGVAVVLCVPIWLPSVPAVFDLPTVAKLFLTLTVLLWHAGRTYLGRVLCGRVPRRAHSEGAQPCCALPSTP